MGSGRWEVGLKNWWEVGAERLVLIICGKWEVGFKNWWEVGVGLKFGWEGGGAISGR